jgi:hypothetical protein
MTNLCTSAAAAAAAAAAATAATAAAAWLQYPTKRQEVHDQLAAVTHRLPNQQHLSHHEYDKSVLRLLLLLQDPTKCQEVHDQLAAVTHKLPIQQHLSHHEYDKSVLRLLLLLQDPTKRQEVHDQLAAVTHKLLISATAPGAAPSAEAAAEAPAGAPEVCIVHDVLQFFAPEVSAWFRGVVPGLSTYTHACRIAWFVPRHRAGMCLSC